MYHNDPDVGIFVLSHPKKQNTTSDVLRRMGVSHSVYVNKDWDLPIQHAEWHTNRSWRPSQRDYAIRQYRAIRGHKEIMVRSDYPVTLVMEDDITHMPDQFIDEAAQVAVELLLDKETARPWYSAVSFHGRNLSPYGFSQTKSGRTYVELIGQVVQEQAQLEFLKPLWHTTKTCAEPLTLRWHEGCLMYAVNTDGRREWVNDSLMSGWPCDLFLVNKINTAVLLDSPVVHGGSSLMAARL